MSRLWLSRIRKSINAAREMSANEIDSFLSRRKWGRETGELAVLSFVMIYTIGFSYFTILKHSVFRSYAWDLGINDQAFWTTLNAGRLFYYTPELYLNNGGSYFGLHFSPAMFFVLPFYAIHQTPETLLILQSFLLALGALPLYWFVRDSLNNKLIAVTFSLTYFLSPVLHGINWFDFHIQAFLPIFFFMVMYSFRKERWGLYFTFILLALSVAENVSFVVLFIGLYALWVHKKSIISMIKEGKLEDKRALICLSTILLPVLWFAMTRLIQHALFPIDPLFSRLYRAVNYYSVLGVQDDPVMVPLYAILNPLNALNALSFDVYLKAVFLVLLYGALFFLPLRSSISFITLAWIGPAMLSNYQPYYVIGDHYPVYILPFIFSAAADGLRKMQTKSPKSINLAGGAKNLLVFTLMFSVLASPLSPLLATTNVSIPVFSQYTLPIRTEHTAILLGIVDLVPGDASILTQNNIFPHFSSRLNAYVVPLPDAMNHAPEEMDEYVHQLLNKSDYVLFDMQTDTFEASSAVLTRISSHHFGLYAYQDGVYLYKKEYGEGPVTQP